MKMNTLTKVRDCLRDGTPEIFLPEDVRAAAEIPLRRMLDWSKLTRRRSPRKAGGRVKNFLQKFDNS